MPFKSSMNYFFAVVELANMFLEGGFIFLMASHLRGGIFTACLG